MSDTPILPIEQVSTSYYLRLRVDDQPGVLADIARLLADRSISIGSMIQQPSSIGGADIIFLTHEALEGNVNAIERIESLPFVRSKVTRLRVEHRHEETGHPEALRASPQGMPADRQSRLRGIPMGRQPLRLAR